MKVLVLLAIAAAASPGLAEAQQAYKWTDEKGQVHYGDAPPQDKKAEAKAIDLVPPVSEDDRQKAQERLARDKAYLKKVDALPASAAKAASPASNPSSSASQSCEQQWKAYNESYACLEPYRVGGANNGGQHILPEGYARCQVLPQPVNCPLTNNP